MKQFFLKIWFLFGAVALIIVTVFLIVVVRVSKFFMGSKTSIKPIPEADIFLDSRKQPLSPNLKNTVPSHEDSL